MAAVWMRARAEIRERRMAIVSTALLCALFGTAVIALVAGARRTDASYPAFLDRHRAFDVQVYDSSIFDDVFWETDFEALESLPYVESAVRFTGGFLDHVRGVPSGIGIIGSFDPAFGRDIQVPLVIKGRLPRGADEVAVPYFAEPSSGDGKPALGIFRLGDRIDVTGPGEPFTLTVVGETVVPGDLPPAPQFGWWALVAPAFFEQHAHECVPFAPSPRCGVGFTIDGLLIQFEHPSDGALFERDTASITGGKAFVPQEQASHAAAVKSSTDLQSSALRVLAALIAISGLLIIAQVLSREVALGAADARSLRDLGMDRRHLFVLGIARSCPVAVLGAIGAVLGAWLASPLFPQGSVRVVEVPTGPVFDTAVLVPGGGAIAVLTLVVVTVPAWRAARSGATAAPVNRPSRSASLLSAVGASVASVAGSRLALERGRGRTAVPVVSSLTIVALGIAAFVAVATFGSSMRTMVDDPRLRGVTWDVVLSTQVDDLSYGDPGAQVALTDRIGRALANDADVEALALSDAGAPIRVFSAAGPERGIPVLGLALDAFKGTMTPPVVQGRAPAAVDEVILGPRMIRSLGLHLDPLHPPSIEAAINGVGESRRTFKVVGRAVIPPLGDFGQLGYGIVFSGGRGITRLLADPSDGPVSTELIVRWAPDADPDAVLARYHDRFPALREGEGITGGRFAGAVDFGGFQAAPMWVGGVLATLAVAALAHVLVTAIRRRRRDIAILKTIGFVRGQARRSVAWQATIMVLIAALVGIPLGIAGGRVLWLRVADGLGVLPRVDISPVVLATLPFALVAVANLIALLPSRTAARAKPALVLRSE